MRSALCNLFILLIMFFIFSIVSCAGPPQSRVLIPTCPYSDPSEQQWATIEKMRLFASEGREDELLLLFTEGEYREYARQQLRTNRKIYLSNLLLSEQKMAELKENFLSGNLPLCFKWEDGLWKFNEH